MKVKNFEQGQILELSYPKPTFVRVLDYIGSGRQGDVYKAQDVKTGELVALKHNYYKYANDKKQMNGMSGKEAFYQKTRLFARTGSPHPAFAWPKAVSDMSKDPISFLYTMPLLEEGYQPVTAAIKNKKLTTEQRLKLAIKLAEPILCLHQERLVFGDISDTNFYIKENADGTFSVRIIDCENINRADFNMGLLGTGYYLPPESIVPDPDNGNMPHCPTIQSDIHAFGVLSFQLFCRHHPLDGELVLAEPDTPETFLKHYGTNPHFCFGKNNNTAFPLAKARWQQLPEPLKLYYMELFSDECLHGIIPRRNLSAFLKLANMSSHT